MKSNSSVVRRAMALIIVCIGVTSPAFAANPRQFTFPVQEPNFDGFYLSFPLSGQTHLTASISGVFDHSMSSPYGTNDAVIAYTGERGEKRFGWDGDTSHPGFKNSSGTNFVINGRYTGAGNPSSSSAFLSFDGHPATDYSAPNGTALYATADGIVGYPASIPGVSDAAAYHTIAIDHRNGYVTYFLHCSTHPSGGNALVAEGAAVLRGQLVAYSGDAGTPGSPHLHLEVHHQGIPVDPYGWSGPDADPYIRPNVDLWNPTRPTLIASFSGTALVVSWPKSAVGFVLEQTAALPAVGWEPGPQPVIVGEQYVVTIPTTGRAEFYRLRK